jgi:hypothetical protein
VSLGLDVLAVEISTRSMIICLSDSPMDQLEPAGVSATQITLL